MNLHEMPPEEAMQLIKDRRKAAKMQKEAWKQMTQAEQCEVFEKMTQEEQEQLWRALSGPVGKEFWKTLRTYKTHNYVEQHADIFQKVQRMLTEFFDAESEGKEYDRKPPLAIRLRVPNAPRMICISPAWNPRYKQLESHKLHLEMIYEESKNGKFYTVSGIPVKLDADGSIIFTRFYYDKEKNIQEFTEIVEVLEDFINDPASVFRRSNDHCVICGKPLTDGASRARGIGPECMDKLSSRGWFTRHSLLEKVCT